MPQGKSGALVLERMTSTYLIDDFVSVTPGEPYRLFPFGTVIKNGIPHHITPDYARRFQIPHFKPAIKLGSHDETTPAGGHIVRLEVMADGLYAVPEFTDKGARAIREGDYRYHSPEVIWDGGGIENPETGEIIAGPLIVGDALLHTPHLGEAAALYSVEKTHQGGNVSNQPEAGMVAVPSGLLDRLLARLFGDLENVKPATLKPAEEPAGEPPEKPAPAPVAVTDTDEFKSIVRERDDLAAKIAEIEAERRRRESLAAITAQLQDKEKFGSAYIDLKSANEAAEMLAGMTDDQRAWVMRNFSAYIAQIAESALTAEAGSAASVEIETDPARAFVAAVEAKMRADKIGYVAAYEAVKVEQADLFKAYLAAK